MWNEDPASTGDGPSLFNRMKWAAVVVAIFLGWKHFNGPSSALAGWNADWNAAVTQSRSNGKPALVLFTADWCPSCRQFESETLSLPDVKSYLAANCTPVIVDLSKRDEEAGRRAAECNVQSIPTLILYDRSGREVARAHGMDAASLKTWINSAGTRF